METLETTGDNGEGHWDGNTIQPSAPTYNKKARPLQLKSWFFTYNNYPPGYGDELDEILKNHKKVKAFVFQEEIGEKSKIKHLQGVIFFKSKTRWTELRLPDQICWKMTRNIEAAVTYCQKEETRAGATWEHGNPEQFTNDSFFQQKTKKIKKEVKVFENLLPWQEEVKIISLTEPSMTDRTIHWYWDPDGNMGKTEFMRHMGVKHEGKICICDNGRKVDVINLVFKCNLDEVITIYFTLTKADGNKLDYSALEAIKDGLIVNTKFETGFKIFNKPNVIIFANYPPKPNKMSIDKFKVTNIKEFNENARATIDIPPEVTENSGCELSPEL